MNSSPDRTTGFVPPPYPYERLDSFKPLAASFDGGLVDLSIGTPCDPPPASVITALAESNSERGYPPSIGTAGLRDAFAAWMQRRFNVQLHRLILPHVLAQKSSSVLCRNG